MSLYLLEECRRYGAFKGSDPMPSSLMKRATGCAQKRGRKMFSRSPMSRGVGWCCIYLLSPFGSAGGDRTRRNSHDERDGDTERGVLVRIRDRSIARGSCRGWGRKASKQASKHGQGSKAGRQGRQACETLPIAVGRGCIDQDEAGRRSLPTPLFPLLALFLLLLAPKRKRGREGFVPSIPCSTLPFFSLVLTATSVLSVLKAKRRHY